MCMTSFLPKRIKIHSFDLKLFFWGTGKISLYFTMMIFKLLLEVGWPELGNVKHNIRLGKTFFTSYFFLFLWKMAIFAQFFSQKAKIGTKELGSELKSIIASLPHGQGWLMQNLTSFSAKMNPQCSTSSLCMLRHRSFIVKKMSQKIFFFKTRA